MQEPSLAMECLHVTFHRSGNDQTAGTGLQVEWRFSTSHDTHAKCTPNLDLSCRYHLPHVICER